ncbi:MAG: SGNH/GDSL hydrolase family protein [Clostridia bacterium]|nr:SGNH/GDSL hydrolase family protein [Clostridia bacterium]MBQ8658431.1 SGNH/GDSL hydrolase family protein [Clostridia bacterium]
MKKETFEWVQSWCDYADKNDKPRVLLVGDSITRGYQGIVRELLKDVAYVDYLSTSYAVDNKLYSQLVEGMAKNSDYALIHFNHGLHGFHMSPRTYKSKIKNLLLRIRGKSKLVLAETTVVYKEGNKRLHTGWKKRVNERNEILGELATELDAELNRLYSVSERIAKNDRHNDGTHYAPKGCEILADAVAECVKSLLK